MMISKVMLPPAIAYLESPILVPFIRTFSGLISLSSTIQKPHFPNPHFGSRINFVHLLCDTCTIQRRLVCGLCCRDIARCTSRPAPQDFFGIACGQLSACGNNIRSLYHSDSAFYRSRTETPRFPLPPDSHFLINGIHRGFLHLDS